MPEPSIWDILRETPEALHSVVNEYLMDPTSQKPLGGAQNAQDYLKSLLQNDGGEGIAEALIKGGLEGVVNTFVPRTSLDVTQATALAAGGAALKGAQGVKAAQEAEAAAKSARGAGRIADVNQRFRAAQGSRNLANKPGTGTGTAQKGYFAGAKGAEARRAADWRDPSHVRPDERTMKAFERSQAALPRQTGPAGPSSFLEGEARAAQGLQGPARAAAGTPPPSAAFDSAAEAAKMEQLIAQNPGAGGGRPTYIGPFSEWLTQQAAKGRPITLEEYLRYTGLP